MDIENKSNSFYDKYESDFDEYLDEIRFNLQTKDKNYMKLYKEMNRLIESSKNIQNIICNEYITEPLSIKDSIKLAKIISLYIDMEFIVQKKTYFKGGSGAYDYFKKLGIIL